ncbi:MAG: hypothetical protein HOQ41_06785 [Ensifer adhaerens]|nr:hypothetical protein [Ensifer adhaerens]
MTKRELIDTGTDKRYVRRDEKGQFKKSVDVSQSLSADRRQKAKNEARPGEGDRGDRRTEAVGSPSVTMDDAMMADDGDDIEDEGQDGGDRAAVSFAFDRVTVQRFRETFPRARWNDRRKAWIVPGKTRTVADRSARGAETRERRVSSQPSA